MAAPGYVLKNRRTTLERAEKFVSDTYFTDCNLKSRLYPKKAPLKSVQHYKAPGRITYASAVDGEYEDTKVGTSFGPTWSTHWFRVEAEIPEDWAGEYVVLRWDSNSEAMVWQEGKPLQGLTAENKRCNFTLTEAATTKHCRHELYIEMACNGTFGAGAGSQIAPPDNNRTYTLSTAEIAVMDRKVYQLIMDFDIIIGLAKNLPQNSNRAYQALYMANDMVNTCDHQDRSSYDRVHKMATEFLSERNGSSQHTVCATGHCHIDTAWLWPYDETIRKCARSWSSTVRLMEEYPTLTFSCSQAQQFAWVKEHYPTLYKSISSRVREGRFIPVGGAWVEMDGNLPSGEAFCRQFLYGQRFFQKEWGITCTEFWLPDTFGYSGQLPQIMRQSGIENFLTQKLSWNLVNKFPHHTFWWAGIDGSQVLAHFPPGDSYNMNGEVEELVYTVDNFRDKGRSNRSLYLFGWGDGGQGPTADMVERIERLRDVDGLAKVEMSTPDEFFTHVRTHDGNKLCVWNGELFFELHNGTYTSQAETKKKNRSCEFLLHNIEAASTLALHINNERVSPFMYPSLRLDQMWKQLLLNQFHDVLPGSSIGLVYKDVLAYYKEIEKDGHTLLTDALQALVCPKATGGETGTVVVNLLSWPRSEIIALPVITDPPQTKRARKDSVVQIDMDGCTLAQVSAPSYGYSVYTDAGKVENPVIVKKENDMIHLKNGYLEAVIDSHGRITSLNKLGCEKDLIVPGQCGNQFVIFDDVPLYWDAWDVMDYHLETRAEVNGVLEFARIIDHGPLRATIQVSLKISDKSYIKQLMSLDAGSPFIRCSTEVAWYESHKFLKVEFPVNVTVASQATYEIQMGHIQRPTTFNTSWDTAKFEVCGHKWADLSEYNLGLAVLNDSSYGWSCIHNTLRLSLLRSPKSPDENADMGTHTLCYGIMPHTGSFQDAGVIQAAYALNCPLTAHSVTIPHGSTTGKGFVSVDVPSVIIETLKKSEDHEKALVLRMYEAYGGRTSAKVKIDLPVQRARICNVLEDVREDGKLALEDGTFSVSLTPFQIVSVLLEF